MSGNLRSSMAMNSHGPTLVVGGRVISGEELREYARRNGLCPICGIYQTHERKGRMSILRTKLEPLTTRNPAGDYIVYKGYCLAPTCHTLSWVKNRLGESSVGPGVPIHADSKPPSWDGSSSSMGSPMGRKQSLKLPPTTFAARHSSLPPPTTTTTTRTSDDSIPAAGVLQRTVGSRQIFMTADCQPASSSSSSSTTTSSSHHSRPTPPAAGAVEDSAPFNSRASEYGPNDSSTLSSATSRPDFLAPPTRTSDRSLLSAGSGPEHIISPGSHGGRLSAGSIQSSIQDVPFFNTAARRETINEEPDLREEISDPLIQEIREKMEQRSYLEFLMLLDRPNRQPAFLVEGFRLLRKGVVTEHSLSRDCCVFPGDNWLKVILDSLHRPEREVVLGALLTMSTICPQSSLYRRSMMRKDSVEAIINIVDKWSDDEAILDTICAIIISLSLSDKGGIDGRSYPKFVPLIRKLGSMIASNQYVGKGMAIQALFHMSLQRKKSDASNNESLRNIRNELRTDESIRAIIAVIRLDQASLCVIQSGLCLLWRICASDDNDDLSFLEGTDQIIGDLLIILERASTEEVLHPCLGLLACLSESPSISSGMAHQVIARICQRISVPEFRTVAVATVSAHAVCNLLGRTGDNIGSSDPKTIADTAVGLLRDFSAQEDIAESCCLTLSQVSSTLEMKELIAAGAIFGDVVSTFEHYITSGNPSATVELACLRFFVSASGCTSGATTLIETGLRDQLLQMQATSIESSRLSLLKTIETNIETHTTNSRADRRVSHPEGARLAERLREATSEQDATHVIAEFYECSYTGNANLDDDGFRELISVMTHFAFSTDLLLKASQLLVVTFSRLPTPEGDSVDDISYGYWAQPNSKRIVEVLCSTIDGHSGSVEVQIGCLYALANLFLPLCTLSESARRHVEVQAWINPVPTHVLGALRLNEDNLKLLESGFFVCWILTSISSQTHLETWAIDLALLVHDSMTRFNSEERLNSLGCEILLRLNKCGDCWDFIVNSTCTSSLLQFVRSENQEIGQPAAALLSAFVMDSLEVTYRFLQLPDSIVQLIECMDLHSSNDQILCHLVRVLEVVINLSDTEFLHEILGKGGLQALMNSIEAQSSNPTLCEHAGRAMTRLVGSANDTSLESLREFSKHLMIPLLSAHADDLHCEVALMDMFQSFAEKDDSFQYTILDMRYLHAIVNAMRVHVGSDDLQSSGCGILRLATGFPDGRRQLGSAAGIQTIVNAMLAHLCSPSVQQEALATLKSLARDSTNKPLLDQLQCVRAVTLSMWANYQHPELIFSALSALNNIAIDSRTKTVDRVTPEILDIILSVMQRFPRVENIQRSACFYLKNCTFLPSNVVLMHERVEGLVAVLMQASELFPQSCQVLAYKVVQRIEG